MLLSIDGSNFIKQTNSVNTDRIELEHLDISFDKRYGVLWKFISENSTPHFSPEQLDDIRTVQSMIRNRANRTTGGGESNRINYVVFGSRIPGVFSLGGDLRLFRDLIRNRDRQGLVKYSRKATDAVFYHAANCGDATSISLVQGVAMGGGFEAALAGNVLVAEKGSKLGFPEVLFGLFPGMGAYTLLRRKVDAATAERIILSAKNYEAEELHHLGIVDILAEPGDGEREIRTYISRQASRPGAVAFRRALNHAHPVDRTELYGIADAWVEAAMELDPTHLKRIDRLVANQDRSFPLKQTPMYVPAVQVAV